MSCQLVAEMLEEYGSGYMVGQLVGTMLIIYVVYWVLKKVAVKSYGKELSTIQRAIIACVAAVIIVGLQVVPYLLLG